jgi:hypothetical protein
VFARTAAAAATFEELEEVVRRAVGPTDLMEFMRLDIGGVVGKERENQHRRLVRVALTARAPALHTDQT